MHRPLLILIATTTLLLPAPLWAKVIQVGAGDDYTKIEAAVAGDVVEIAPGTYRFRVMLSQTGTAASPITIRAKDPTNRPVWDLHGKPVQDWPGSYTAGDRGRGCWQVKGSYYVISGIVLRNCQDSSSAGLRAINSGPVTVRDCLFEGNTNGLTGSAQDLVVEHCELKGNGKQTTSGAMTHNLYVYGGHFTLRYSYVHDPYEGQNFHIRAHEALLEYNWIARPDSYPGDLMSCNTLCGGSGSSPVTQKMTLRGNVIIQGTPKNTSQLIALYNDEATGSYDSTGAVSAMELTLISNTVIGSALASGKTQRLVNMRNDSVDTKVHLSNNIVYQVHALTEAASPAKTNWSVDGQSNWVSVGTSTSGVSGTLSGTDPGFVAAVSKDFTLTAASPCRGKAAAISDLPVKEYYRDETVKLMYRVRSSAKDLGAFEHGTKGEPQGPYGPASAGPDGGPWGEGGLPDLMLPDGLQPEAGGGPPPDGGEHLVQGEGSCNCLVGDAARGPAGPLLMMLGLYVASGILGARKKSRQVPRTAKRRWLTVYRRGSPSPTGPRDGASSRCWPARGRGGRPP